MSVTVAKVASHDPYLLGEGPSWDPVDGRLLWVDIVRGAVFEGKFAADDSLDVKTLVTLPETIGAATSAADGTILIAGAKRVYRRSPDGTVEAGPQLISDDDDERRLNDGKPDPSGAFVVGTLNAARESTTERLIRIEPDGGQQVLDDDLTLSNGLAWTANGHVLYSVDTRARTIYSRDYDPETGATGRRRSLLRLEEGFPDGLCLDAEEHLWVAVWGRGEVRRYSPSGELEQVIAVPAPNVSSVAFVGPQLRTLVITTARQELAESALQAYPLSGHLFSAVPPVPGLPQPAWNGSFVSERERTETS